MGEHEINYDALIDLMRKALGDEFDVHKEYYELLNRVGNKELINITTTVANNMMFMSTRDQILLLRTMDAQQKLAAVLAKKYGLGKKADNEETLN